MEPCLTQAHGEAGRAARVARRGPGLQELCSNIKEITSRGVGVIPGRRPV